MTKELLRSQTALRRFLRRQSGIRNPNPHRFQPDSQISRLLPNDKPRRIEQGEKGGFVIGNILPETTIKELNSLFRVKKKRRH